MQITMNPDQNSVTIRVNNFKMQVHSQAKAKAILVSADGDATISITIRSFVFTASPKIREDGNFNAIDFDIHDLSLDIPGDGMHFDHLSIGIIPDWMLRPFTNLVFQVINGQFKVFNGVIADAAKSALNNFKNLIPSHIDIPTTQYAMSLSVPQIPLFNQEKSYIYMDGAIFLQKAGYNP